VPHVASKATVLPSHPTGVGQRDRMSEAKTSTSPFAMLLDETSAGSASRNSSARTSMSAPAPRDSVAPPSATERSQRQDENRVPEATETAASDPSGTATPAKNAAADQPTIAESTSDVAEDTTPSTTDTDPAPSDDASVIDAALAATASPAQPVPTPSLPGTPAPANTDGAGADRAATAPDTELAGSLHGVGDGATPVAPPTSHSGQTAPAPHSAGHQAAHRGNAPHANVPADQTVMADAAESSGESAAPEATMTKVAGADGGEHANGQHTEESSQRPNAEASTHASGRAHGSDAAERIRAANTPNESVQSVHTTPDGLHLAHLQGGRDGTHAITATANAAQGADASNQMASAPVPLESLAVEIAARALNGRNRFEIRLDPPELGRVEVRLDIDRSGQVTSRLVVEKAETLDMLRRDAHQLERALQDAGLKTSDNGMQFSLRDQAFAERQDRGESEGVRTLVADPDLPAAEGAALAYGLTLRGGSGVDIRV
jgi:flagellar hook-length control protein FliK